MLNASLKELSAALVQRKISSVELTRLFLERVEKLNGSLNAFITVDAEKSLAQARAADERIAKGATQPLTGIPVAHKDIFVDRKSTRLNSSHANISYAVFCLKNKKN